MHRAIVVITMWFIFMQGYGQTLTFDAILFGKKVGTITIQKIKERDATTRYILDSYIKAKVLWISRESIVHQESRYREGRLIFATYTETNNGRQSRWVNVSPVGKGYEVETERERFTLSEQPTFSTGPLYFEPYNAATHRIFSEAEGVFFELKHIHPHQAEFKNGEGTRNIYLYDGDQIVAAEFHTTLATVYLQRVK